MQPLVPLVFHGSIRPVAVAAFCDMPSLSAPKPFGPMTLVFGAAVVGFEVADLVGVTGVLGAGVGGVVDVADGEGLPVIGAAAPSTRCTPWPQAATRKTVAAAAIREIRMVVTSLCALSLGAMRPFSVEFGA